nr:protein FAM149B1 [Ciona intestinalis]|eukprot:XP_002129894.1 protein FAM149B1 [Ciona intestinalis]
MTGRFTRQPASVLEIRGISRGSILDHPRVEPVDEPVMGHPASHGLYYLNPSSSNIIMDSDDDDSTITGGSDRGHPSSPHSPHSEATITASDSTNYWSADNSFSTGNTTERSSVYSWGDDEFDLQASRLVRQMFHAIEQMLFEGVLSGSTSLQQECREWMSAFPHLRILGKQIVTPQDDAFQIIPTDQNSNCDNLTTGYGLDSNTNEDSEILQVKGIAAISQPIPSYLLEKDPSHNEVAHNSLSHLVEEVYEQDGKVEEYLAYDIKEMDEEEHAKRYHVPHRRRLGFPPITPNACVRDAVLHHIFDLLWSRVVPCLAGSGKERSKMSILKVLVHNYMASQSVKSNSDKSSVREGFGEKQTTHGNENSIQESYFTFEPRRNASDGEDDFYDPTLPGIIVDRVGHPGSSLMMHPSLSIPPRLLYQDSMALPPSRGSYLDQASGNNGRHVQFTPARLSTAPNSNHGNLDSLNDVMKISQKKLQVRSDKVSINEDLAPGILPDSRFPARPSSSHYINGVGSNIFSPVSHHLSAIGSGTSPLSTPNRPYTSRELFGGVTGGTTSTRQPSATARKGRVNRPARLLPLDRAKTPNVEFNGIVKATKLTRPGNLEPTSQSFSGFRVNSPPSNFQPPPTAPNPSTGGNSHWVNPRLPPIHSLEALQENSLVEFKKLRGKSAHHRISSALAEEKPVHKSFDMFSRPNTTHTFRTDNLIQKRATSITPSNLAFGAQGNSLGITGLKTSSPSGFVSGPGNPHLQLSSTSPDNGSGLAGITGIGINVFSGGHSPDDKDDETWGQPLNQSNVRRKRTVMGFI